MLVGAVLLEMLLDEETSCSVWVSCVQDVDQHIGGVNHFVEFLPNTLGGSLFEDVVPDFGFRVEDVPLVQVVILLHIVHLVGLLGLCCELLKRSGDGVGSFPSVLGPEGVLEALDLQQSLAGSQGLVIVLAHKTQGQLLALHQHLEPRALLLLSFLQSFAVSIQVLLVRHSHVTEPPPVGLYFACLACRWSLLHFLQIGL